MSALTSMSPPATARRNLPLVPGVLLLAFGLVGAIWAYSYFNAEARVRRATGRLIELARKPGAETPVALGLSAHRFGARLATNAVLEVAGYDPGAEGRQEIVQLFVQIRDSCTQIQFLDPQILTVVVRRGEIMVRVAARYRLALSAGDALEGAGRGTLHWVKGEDGWMVRRAVLEPDAKTAIPKGWP